MQTDARAEPARPDGRRRRVGALSQSPGATEPKADPSGQNVTVARVLLGVTGGIAAYKACELVRLLVRAGHEVVPLVTPGADRFVTAGGTREPLDSVRYLGNRSSGRMGVALAREARRRGAEVTLLASNLTVASPSEVEVVQAPTAEDVAREALARSDADLVLMAAAVADYRPAEAHAGKRPKDDAPWEVRLEPTTDVLTELAARRRNGSVLVGFAADEGERGLERAREKRNRKGADLIVYNDVGRTDIGFDAVENEVVVISAEGERRIPKTSKERVAAAILDEAETLLGGRDGRGRG